MLRWMTLKHYYNERGTVTVLARGRNLAELLWKLQEKTGIEHCAWSRLMHLITINQSVGYRITVKTFFGRHLYSFQ